MEKITQKTVDEQKVERIGTARLSRALNKTPRTIERWRKDGVIPYFRVNSRSFLYDLQAVLAALERFSVRAKP